MKARGSTLLGIAPGVLKATGTQTPKKHIHRYRCLKVCFPPSIFLTDKNDFISSSTKDLAKVTSLLKPETLRSFLLLYAPITHIQSNDNL